MPKEYDLTLCYNVRAYSKTVIEAESFEDAKAKARKYWTEGETDYSWMGTDYGDEADACEPVLCVDDVDGNQDDEITDPGYVYRSELLAFASKVAGLTLGSEATAGLSETEIFDTQIDRFESDSLALNELILEARKLTGIK